MTIRGRSALRAMDCASSNVTPEMLDRRSIRMGGSPKAVTVSGVSRWARSSTTGGAPHGRRPTRVPRNVSISSTGEKCEVGSKGWGTRSACVLWPDRGSCLWDRPMHPKRGQLLGLDGMEQCAYVCSTHTGTVKGTVDHLYRSPYVRHQASRHRHGHHE